MAIDPKDVLKQLGIKAENDGAWAGEWYPTSGPVLSCHNPATGDLMAKVRQATRADYDKLSGVAVKAFEEWREWPAPKRGALVRDLAEAFRKFKDPLGALVTMETGKILPEGKGEIQEAIDIGDFAVGLSRQLYGLTMHSERAKHRMYEQWHPLGVVGVITAFNFPIAVWAWNALIAAVCGDASIWKPSPKTPLTAIATQHVVNGVLAAHKAPPFLSLIIGENQAVGQAMLEDRRIPLVSATGSVGMGRTVAEVVGRRLGRTLLELGGNNAVIVMDDADLDLAVRAVLFGACGTAGQRCTSIRRLVLHEKIAEPFIERLVKSYGQVKIGNPLEPGVLMGPLVDEGSADRMVAALRTIKEQGGEVILGGKRLTDAFPKGSSFVEPTLVRSKKDMPMLQEEVFAPVLHILTVASLEEAIAVQNGVPQGLSSAIFTSSMRASERFLSPAGSDCGIANVNIGTSGAEIGGAFGGEKDTGGGRESGSDSWKAYMRRQTCTINFGTDLPLAQGITFGT